MKQRSHQIRQGYTNIEIFNTIHQEPMLCYMGQHTCFEKFNITHQKPNKWPHKHPRIFYPTSRTIFSVQDMVPRMYEHIQYDVLISLAMHRHKLHHKRETDRWSFMKNLCRYYWKKYTLAASCETKRQRNSSRDALPLKPQR